MKRRIRIFLCCLLLVVGRNVHAGAPDTSLIILRAKMLMVDFLSDGMKPEDYHKFINCSVGYKILSSKGFRDILFISIDVDAVARDSGTATCRDFLQMYIGEFIIAYAIENQQVYRLKGYKTSDGYDFLRYIQSMCWLDGQRKLTRKYFLQNFSIEHMNMDCLHRALTDKKKRNNCMYTVHRSDMTNW